MLNLLLGSSGGGKSYEANRYQMLEALKRGRKVITNLPILLEGYLAIDPTFHDLIERRTKPQPIRGTWEPTREEGAFNVAPEEEWTTPARGARVFAGVWDYYSEWRHPETGQGPLFIIDEAQNVMPRMGTDKEVEEWTALHRHWGVDCLIITQSANKLSPAVRENVQMVYRVRKKVAWGQPDKYIRKVQDGLRGEVMNVTEREYDSAYFCLYKSHTQGAAVEEANAQDVRPWWKHWTWYGVAICAVLAVGIFAFTPAKLNPAAIGAKPGTTPAGHLSPTGAKPIQASAQPSQQPPQAPQAPPPPPKEFPDDGLPLAGRGLHVVGTLKVGSKTRVQFAVSQNGQRIYEVDSFDLAKLGYDVDPVTPCAVRVSNGRWSRWILCDAPQVAVPLDGNGTSERPKTDREDGKGGTREAGGSLTHPPQGTST